MPCLMEKPNIWNFSMTIWVVNNVVLVMSHTLFAIRVMFFIFKYCFSDLASTNNNHLQLFLMGMFLVSSLDDDSWDPYNDQAFAHTCICSLLPISKPPTKIRVWLHVSKTLTLTSMPLLLIPFYVIGISNFFVSFCWKLGVSTHSMRYY